MFVFLVACGADNNNNSSSIDDGLNQSESFISSLDFVSGNSGISESAESENDTNNSSLDITEEMVDSSAVSDIISDDITDVFEETMTYVALGDSIAYGYGLENPNEECYAGLLADKISSNYNVGVDYKNFAVSGMDTTSMLQHLEVVGNELTEADLITLCIGANNLLHPFVETIGTTLTDIGVIINGDIPGIDLDKIGEIATAFGEMLESDELKSAFEEGIEVFKKEFPIILAKIKECAPNAKIAVMTVYSPYKGIELSLPYLEQSVDLGSCSDEWVATLNEQIVDVARNNNCFIIETYNRFQLKDNLVNAKLSIVPFKFSFDPHPTIDGHRYLAELHYSGLKNILF